MDGWYWKYSMDKYSNPCTLFYVGGTVTVTVTVMVTGSAEGPEYSFSWVG